MELTDLLLGSVAFLLGAIAASLYHLRQTSLLNRLYVGVGHDSYGWYWRVEACAKRFDTQNEAVEDLRYYGIHDYTEE